MAGSTVISSGTRIAGPLFSKDDLTIDGTVEGPVTGEGRITIGPSAEVQGEVRGSEVVIAGRLRWSVHAVASIRLLASAEVQGDLAAPRVAIDEGAVFEGQVRMLRKPAANAAATPGARTPEVKAPAPHAPKAPPAPSTSPTASPAFPPHASAASPQSIAASPQPIAASPLPVAAREIPTLAVPGKKTLVRRTK